MTTPKSCALFLALLATFAHGAVPAATSEWVHPGPDGKLIYKTTPAGDRIMDFSYAGYMGGGVALPDVPVRKTIKPSGGEDDTALIQAAIDEVAKLPLENGFRGAVLLEAGIYPCTNTLTISTSGVVLRGSGAEGGTTSTIKMTGRPHLALAVRMPRAPGRAGGDAEGDDAGSAHTLMADPYVPSGAMSFNVENTSGFAAGDTISIRRPVTDAWIKFMHMDDLTRDGRPQTWIRAGSTTVTERTIAAIAGNKITLDVPLSDSFDSKYLNPPGTAVVKIRPPARVSQVGIENLHIECPPQEISHTQPHFQAMRINGQDCWAQDVRIDETMNSVGVGGKRITLQRVSVNRKARHQGASKPAEFAPNGGQVLLDRCSVSGDNIFYIATGAGQSGPIVILNCTFLGNGRSESHQRWSTGMLYDNCRVPEGGIEIRNRGAMGSGHGWSMGWGAIWNCSAKDYIVQNPPGTMNWLIGSIGENKLSPRPFDSAPNMPEGTIDSAGSPVTPQSLYLTQLMERLGPQALKNIGYSSTNVQSGSFDKSPVRPVRVEADKELGRDLAIDRPVTATNVREGKREFAAWQALDGDDSTYWATDDGKLPANLELDTEGGVDTNAVEIAEAAGMTGRVQEYKVEGMVNSDWKVLSQGTTIGDRKIDRFPRVTVWKVRLTISRASAYPAIRHFGIYMARSQ
ncbi:MAG TPA: discoidin domain-containing protein [Tepidisphaeraceae bacterium]|jgi:hypothetical protein